MASRAAHCAVALALAGTLGASAHDLWIEPSSFTPAPGVRLGVRLFIGQLFEGDPFPRDPQLLRRFAVLRGDGGAAAGAAGGEEPIPGIPDTDPAGFLVTGPAGLYELVYASGHAAVQLDAAKFEKYLAEEGLEAVSAQRARAGRSGAPAKEIFSRCAKSLIAVGGSSAAGATGARRLLMPLGLTLELVAEANPYALGPGQELPVRLLYGGRPLAGAKVSAVRKPPPDRRSSPLRPPLQVAARTDAQGRARLPLGASGVWLIKAVHMIAAPPGSGADWESFWASLTFALPGGAAR